MHVEYSKFNNNVLIYMVREDNTITSEVFSEAKALFDLAAKIQDAAYLLEGMTKNEDCREEQGL